MEFTGYLDRVIFPKNWCIGGKIVKHKIQIWLALHLRGLGLKLLPIYI